MRPTDPMQYFNQFQGVVGDVSRNVGQVVSQVGHSPTVQQVQQVTGDWFNSSQKGFQQAVQHAVAERTHQKLFEQTVRFVFHVLTEELPVAKWIFRIPGPGHWLKERVAFGLRDWIIQHFVAEGAKGTSGMMRQVLGLAAKAL
ncbi:MAG: hypothetical protein SFZ03_00555 [Candidatus Melainabacteria bacterium]|nr:hypothetical protein [Candidatus Melainabacteria bacterium]